MSWSLPWTRQAKQVDRAVEEFARQREAVVEDNKAASRRLILTAMGRAAGENSEVDDELQQIPHQ